MKLRNAAVFLLVTVFMFPVFAEKKGVKIQSTIKEGKYNETDILTASKLPYLPIPGTKEDYVIYQSIGKVSNIVIGRFSGGEKEIIFLSDDNGDGKVKTGSIYYPDLKKFKTIAQPNIEYPAERFKKLKLDVINGVQGEVTPNREGSDFIKKSVDKRSDLVMKVRTKNGFRVFVNDADDSNIHRAIFYYSNNRKSGGGADLAFKVEYNNVGNQMVSPIINFCVYCKDSEDPVAFEAVDDLSKYTAKFLGE
jgi:hypothetical protein